MVWVAFRCGAGGDAVAVYGAAGADRVPEADELHGADGAVPA